METASELWEQNSNASVVSIIRDAIDKGRQVRGAEKKDIKGRGREEQASWIDLAE